MILPKQFRNFGVVPDDKMKGKGTCHYKGKFRPFKEVYDELAKSTEVVDYGVAYGRYFGVYAWDIVKACTVPIKYATVGFVCSKSIPDPKVAFNITMELIEKAGFTGYNVMVLEDDPLIEHPFFDKQSTSVVCYDMIHVKVDKHPKRAAADHLIKYSSHLIVFWDAEDKRCGYIVRKAKEKGKKVKEIFI